LTYGLYVKVTDGDCSSDQLEYGLIQRGFSRALQVESNQIVLLTPFELTQEMGKYFLCCS